MTAVVDRRFRLSYWKYNKDQLRSVRWDRLDTMVWSLWLTGEDRLLGDRVTLRTTLPRPAPPCQRSIYIDKREFLKKILVGGVTVCWKCSTIWRFSSIARHLAWSRSYPAVYFRVKGQHAQLNTADVLPLLPALTTYLVFSLKKNKKNYFFYATCLWRIKEGRKEMCACDCVRAYVWLCVRVTVCVRVCVRACV